MSENTNSVKVRFERRPFQESPLQAKPVRSLREKYTTLASDLAKDLADDEANIKRLQTILDRDQELKRTLSHGESKFEPLRHPQLLSSAKLMDAQRKLATLRARHESRKSSLAKYKNLSHELLFFQAGN